MTSDPTAPKIDTTREAVERLAEFHGGVAKSYDDYIRGPYTTTKANHMAVEATLRALLDERDLADARAAAAVMAMREAAAEEAKSCCHEGDYVARAIRTLPTPADAQAALDRRIAERVREAVEAARQDERTAIAAYIGMSPSEVTDRQYHMEAIRTGRYRDDPLMQSGGWMEGGDSGETDR
ncbi:hypothetical protein [Paracoccus sp. 22332]|uniref:hypothetical protein n=1 Tax=Paracoccus sp. 22332 TaxID=3453913 RepID=UPI003F83DE1F